jgi:hypothetical protein
MDTSAWLAEVDGISHDQRIKRAVALGLRAKDEVAEARAIARDLARSESPYQRRLALASAFTSRDGALVFSMVCDPSRLVRSLALRLVALACDDAQALEATKLSFEMGREKKLLGHLARAGRSAVVDACIDWLAKKQGIVHFADLLTYASASAVRRHIARALSRPSTTFWTRLARQHPTALAGVLEDRVRAQRGDADDVTRMLLREHLGALAGRVPDAVLSLSDAMLERGSRPDAAVIAKLAARRPEATSALLVKHGIAQVIEPRSSKSALDALSDEAFAQLARDAPAMIQRTDALWWKTASESRLRAVARVWLARPETAPRWGSWALRYLAPSPEREAAFERWSVALRDHRGVIAPHELDALPHELAEREAWRHLREVSALHTQPQARAEYARFLSWNDARSACADLLAHPEGEHRAVALRVLLQIAGRRKDAALVTDAVALVTARKFEQDPVRRVMLEALSQWPRESLAMIPLETIAKIVRDALDASDLSASTAAYAEKLVLRSFGRDAAWGAQWLAVLLRERGQLYDYHLGRHLSADDLRAAAPTLLEVAREWAKRERSGPFVQLLASIDARVALVPGMSALALEHALSSPWPEVSQWCALVLARHDRASIDPAFSQLFSRWTERRWWTTVTAFARGAIASAGFAWPEALSEALDQTARRAAYASEVEQALAALRAGDRAGYERRLGALVDADPSLIALSSVRNHLHLRRQELLAPFVAGRVVTGRFATGMTAWVLLFRDGLFRWTPTMNAHYARALEAVLDDEKRDTPTLLSCVSALPALVYADMRGLCARASDPRAAVQEKAIRVLARCDAGQGLGTLIECLGDGRARFAVYALRKALSDVPATQAIQVLSAAPMQKVTVAKEVLRLLGSLRADAAFERLIAIDREPKLHRDVRIALMRALWEHLERPESWAIYERAVREGDWITASRVGDVPANYLTAESDRKLSALLAKVLERPDVEARLALLQRAQTVAVTDPDRVMLRAIEARLSSMYSDEVAAATQAILSRGRDADLGLVAGAFVALSVDRRAFGEAIRGLCALPIRSWTTWQQAARAIIDALSDDPRHSATCARIAGVTLPVLEFAQWIERRAARGALHADALYACKEGVEKVHQWELEEFVERLAKSDQPAARRVAVWALQRDAGPDRGWTLPRLKRLRALRDDADVMVSAAACDVFPPREMDPG